MNRLDGRVERIDDRLVYLGDGNRQGRRHVYVLALLADQAEAAITLASLPHLLPHDTQRIVVVCPSFRPQLKLQRLLDSPGITVVNLTAEAPFSIPPSNERTPTTGDTPFAAAFRHSPDYREVWLRDEKFDLTTNQARVVQLLFEIHRAGTPAVGQGYLLEELDIRSTRLSQVFRGSKAWGKLIVSPAGRGMYSLNL